MTETLFGKNLRAHDCSTPPGGNGDILASFLGSCHVLHLYKPSMAKTCIIKRFYFK